MEKDLFELENEHEESYLPFPEEMDDIVAEVRMKLEKSDHEDYYSDDEITAIKVEVLADCDKGSYRSGPVSVSIRTKRGTRRLLSGSKCYIYDETFFPMCGTTIDSSVQPEEGGVVTLKLTSPHIWLPGRYLLLLQNNQTGIPLKVELALDEQMQTLVGTPEYCAPLGLEDSLLSCVQESDPAWPLIAEMPGAAQMRLKVIQSRQLALYNEFRKERSGMDMRTCENLLICIQGNDFTEDVMNKFGRMVALDYSFNYIDCATLFDLTRTNPYELFLEKIYETNMQVFCLTRLSELTGSSGKVIVRRIVDRMRSADGKMLLWLCGSRREIDNLLEMYPSLRRFFQKDSYVEQQPYTAFELVQAFLSQITRNRMKPSLQVEDRLSRIILKGHEQGTLANWTLDDIRQFVSEDIVPRYLKRAMGMLFDDAAPLLIEDDIDFTRLTRDNSDFEESVRELNEMTGLDEVKEGVMTMANQARLYLERRRRGLKTSNDMIFHAIFTGNPGTGKTTVARKIGKIYRSLGLLSKGEVIPVDRTRLVGQYIGQTEENMKAILEEAKGNVLFVDEAYTLITCKDDKKDFGGRVLDSLLTVLTQPNPDMLIIFAGYANEMETMLSTNPGLEGRFPYRYKFADYSAEQLMDIARRLLDADEYILTDEAKARLQDAIDKALGLKLPNFGNARWVKQFVCNGIIPAMADRVYTTGSDDLQRIEASDVMRASEKFSPKPIDPKPTHHRVQGFGA